MKQNTVQMRFSKGTGDLRFEIDPDINAKYHQIIYGNGYRWDGNNFHIMNHNRLVYIVENVTVLN